MHTVQFSSPYAQHDVVAAESIVDESGDVVEIPGSVPASPRWIVACLGVAVVMNHHALRQSALVQMVGGCCR